MWAQIIKTRLEPGKDAALVALLGQFKATEQPHGPARELMAEIFDGAPEFVDLDVVAEHVGR